MVNDHTPAPGSSGAGRGILTASGIVKNYGGIRALRGADISLQRGQIHGLIGENGSGKSTLLGVLSGQTIPDEGSLASDGESIAIGDTKELRRHVAIVTQELSLAPDLSVAENIVMSHDKPRTWRGISWQQVNRKAAIALERLNLDIDPRIPVGQLRIDQQQLVEIAKAVELQHPVLILDEPTSSLTEDSVAALADTMRRLRDSGTSIVFVSHRLDEMFALTDHITVLRDGRTVGSRPTAEYNRDTLVEEMLGYAVEKYEHSNTSDRRTQEPIMRARAITVPGRVDNVSLDVFPGEVVGLVGLEGAGRTELLESLFGTIFLATGDMDIAGKSGLPRSPIQAMARGIALVPADRKNDGLMLDMSIEENINMATNAGGLRFRIRHPRREAVRAEKAGATVHIQSGSIAREVGSLSGGNQQKVLLGKWLETQPTLMLLDEPTRGVDVGAKREIHKLIYDLRDKGMGVVVSSSDIEELLILSDRFIVMFRGRIVGEVSRADASEARLSHLATGGSQ